MKIRLVAGSFLLILVAAGSCLAGQAQNNCGCGLGTMLWANKADGSILSQTMQVTTNGLFGNQTFGITSGTLGCEQPESIGADDRTFAYVRDNMDTLARDIAVGQGEYLDTLAELMSVPEMSKEIFNDSLQKNFGQIFVTGDESAGVILERIVTTAG